MTIMDERRRPAHTSESAAAPVVEWIDAPLIDGEEPRDGHLADPYWARSGDYLLVYQEATGTAVWSLIRTVASFEGQTHIWYGQDGRVEMKPPAGMRLWILRQDEAAALLRGRPRASEMTDLQIQVAFEHVLRTASLEDLTAAWQLLHDADAAEVDLEGAGQ